MSNDAGLFNVFDASGQLINSSKYWPIPNVNIAIQLLQGFAATSTRARAARGGRRPRRRWMTTVIARKVVARTDGFLGVVSRDVSPATSSGSSNRWRLDGFLDFDVAIATEPCWRAIPR